MTLRERVIVETYTGVCMTTGEERNELYKYMAEIMGRPVYTHELADKGIQLQLKENSFDDFIALCVGKQASKPVTMIKAERILTDKELKDIKRAIKKVTEALTKITEAVKPIVDKIDMPD